MLLVITTRTTHVANPRRARGSPPAPPCRQWGQRTRASRCPSSQNQPAPSCSRRGSCQTPAPSPLRASVACATAAWQGMGPDRAPRRPPVVAAATACRTHIGGVTASSAGTGRRAAPARGPVGPRVTTRALRQMSTGFTPAPGLRLSRRENLQRCAPGTTHPRRPRAARARPTPRRPHRARRCSHASATFSDSSKVKTSGFSSPLPSCPFTAPRVKPDRPVGHELVKFVAPGVRPFE